MNNMPRNSTESKLKTRPEVMIICTMISRILISKNNKLPKTIQNQSISGPKTEESKEKLLINPKRKRKTIGEMMSKEILVYD